MDTKQGSYKCILKIKNFSSIKQKKLYSEIFGGNYKWQVIIYPKGDSVDHLSIYLHVAGFETLPDARSAQTTFTVINQIDRKNSRRQELRRKIFSEDEPTWGLSEVLPLSELQDPRKGYLVNDACIIEVEVSCDLVNETNYSAKFKGKEPNHTKTAAIISKKKTVVAKSEEIKAWSMEYNEETWVFKDELRDDNLEECHVLATTVQELKLYKKEFFTSLGTSSSISGPDFLEF